MLFPDRLNQVNFVKLRNPTIRTEKITENDKRLMRVVYSCSRAIDLWQD